MKDRLIINLKVLTKPLSYAGAALLFLMMLLTVCDVIGRYGFNSPIMGTFELTEFMMVCLVFSSLAYTQSQDGHIAVDILVSRFPKSIQEIAKMVNYLITLLVLMLIAWMSIERGFEMKASNQCSGTLLIPVYPFVFAVAFGSAAMGFEIIVNLIKTILRRIES
jgi:TRAP-type C4-dicarboxylate transport system permease small subunit